MSSFRSALCVLLLLIFTREAETVYAVTTAKLHDPALLPCSERCSGVVRWTAFHNPTDVLAECDRTSCRSKEGYQMVHEDYLKGNLSLIISGADFSRRARYISDCDGQDLCDVRLQIEALKTTLDLKPGRSLVMDLDVSDAVELVHYSSVAAGRSRLQVCTADGRTLQCRPEYRQRTSLALEMRGMKESDSGVYVLRDTRNDEDIHIYTVIVKDDCDSSEAQNPEDLNRASPELQLLSERDCISTWMVVVLVTALTVSAVVNGCFCLRTLQGLRCSERIIHGSRDQRNGQTSSSPEQIRLPSSSNDQDQV